jgi:alkanesulfonate monooxygenase SsuD/methylene tetrahydromethanopterin reductase-like flavin-dependent oxidoreductase (luciferase family)
MIDATRTRPLKVGFILYPREGKMLGKTPRWQDLRAMAEQAEQTGFDSIWLVDHFVMPIENEPKGFWECWSVLSALAAMTSRVELGTVVLGGGYRNPALLAKMADTVEEISGGRLILGLGAGYHDPEYRQFGYPTDYKVARFEEAIQIIHGLLRHGRVDFEGKYWSARECELRPRGPRPEGPPIMIGSTAPRMLRTLIDYGEMWNAFYTDTNNRASGIAPLRETVDAACRAAGRDPASVEGTACVMVHYPEHGSNRTPYDIPPLTGTPEEIAEELRAYAREGISHVQVSLEPMLPATLAAFQPVLELLDAEG